MSKDPTSWMLKPITDKMDEISEREAQLIKEHEQNIIQSYEQGLVTLEDYDYMYNEYQNYKARMKKYEWIDNLLQTTTRFLRHPLSKQHR